MRYYFIPEIIFSIFVLYFLWSIPTYTAAKVIFTAIYFILLTYNAIEQWKRKKMVNKVKEEKKKQLDMEITRIKSQQEEIARQEQEKARLKAKEEQEFKQKMQEKKQKDTEKAFRETQERKKQAVRSEIGHYLQGFVNKNFRILINPDYISLINLIKKKGLDTRLLFAPGVGEDKLEDQLGELKGRVNTSLDKLVAMGAEYQENFRIFVNFLQDKGFNLQLDLLQEIVKDEVENKKYQNFKTQLYNEKKALKYTTDVKDYINAFVELYGQGARQRIGYFARLLEEEIDRNFTMEIVKPLVEQELVKRNV